jgi:glucose-1-phosphate thymidylyltransferase
MKAILLCAGYATRLRPLTDNCPKHLLKVGGKTILDHVLHKTTPLPLEAIYLVTNNKFYSHFESWHQEHYRGTIPLEVVNDGTLSNEDRLGSIGDVEYVLETRGINEDLLIINADNLFTFELKPLYDHFLKKKNVIACYDVGDVKEARKMGVPTTDDMGRIIDFVEKPENPSSTEVAIGIYFYSQEGCALIKEYVAELKDQGKRPDTTGDFVGWLSERLPVYTYSYSAEEEKWVDIGTPEQYESVRNADCFG